tara:strand:+ start:155 stop:382 length:228 start_codon:yes stop_codon:yes gene_type:complete
MAVRNLLSLNYVDIISKNSNDFISTKNIEVFLIRKIYNYILEIKTYINFIILILFALLIVDSFITSITHVTIVIF